MDILGDMVRRSGVETCGYGLRWWKERDCVRWRAYEVGDRDESVFSRLLDRLKGAEIYEADDYPVYGVGWLLRDRHMIGSAER